MADNIEPGVIIPPALAIKSMRDSGYKNTAYALAELIDNSIQANAKIVEVFCREVANEVDRGDYKRLSEIAVYDNGEGMTRDTLCKALQFGNGTRLDDRNGMGRFGMGLPSASVSQCRHIDIWTWQAGTDNAIYTYLDIDEVVEENMTRIPRPVPKRLPDEWLLHMREDGPTGTLIVWSSLDIERLTWKKAEATFKHTEHLVGRMYRRFINQKDVEIHLITLTENGPERERNVKVNDPLYLMTPSTTPAPFDQTPMFQEWGDKPTLFDITYKGQKHTVTIRMSWARSETIQEAGGNKRGDQDYGKHAAKNIGVSVLRAGRELFLDNSWAIVDHRERWWGCEIDFPPTLDEVFGVTNNKQRAENFSRMSNFNWIDETEAGEDYGDFRDRISKEGDSRFPLIEIVRHIQKQLSKMRSGIKDQMKGRRIGNQRHDDISIEDTTTEKWKERGKVNKIPSDSEKFDDVANEKLVQDLIEEKHYDKEIAGEIATAVRIRGRKVIFVESENRDSEVFFGVEPQTGGVTEVVFNTAHPVHKRLFETLVVDDIDNLTGSDSDLVERICNASDMLKLLFAAWARYEEEDIDEDKNRKVRIEWGRMARVFIQEET